MIHSKILKITLNCSDEFIISSINVVVVVIVTFSIFYAVKGMPAFIYYACTCVCM